MLNSQQFGFRKNLATEDAIFKLTLEILTALNSKKWWAVFSLVWQKPLIQLIIRY
jgi:hypothetical protein